MLHQGFLRTGREQTAIVTKANPSKDGDAKPPVYGIDLGQRSCHSQARKRPAMVIARPCQLASPDEVIPVCPAEQTAGHVGHAALRHQTRDFEGVIDDDV